MSVQLELRPVDWGLLYDELRDLFRQCVYSIGAKEVAYLLDISRSQLANACEGRNGNHIQLQWFLPVALKAPGGLGVEMFAWMARLLGLNVVPIEPATPADELRAIQEVIAENFAPDLRATLAAKIASKLKRGR